MSSKRTKLQRALGSEPIPEEGGKFGAGVIRGVSLATVGEALGHDMWLDQTTIEQVVELTNGTGETGLKARFTHPDMCSDGLGKGLGRLLNARVDGEKALADLHFFKSASKSPEGDLAGYFKDLVSEDPEAAGMSIAFMHDLDAEDEFEAEHKEEHEYEDYRGRTVKEMRFKSPDERNENNYFHVRIAELRATDAVDEPAANPDGMFDRSPLARTADQLLSYAAGLTDDKPSLELSEFSIEPDRAGEFLSKWLSRHNLSIVPKEDEQMSEPSATAPENPAPQTPAVTKESILAEQQKFVDRFGAENGVKWFTENVSYTEALEKFADDQKKQIEELSEKLKQAEERLSSLQIGEEPIETESKPGDGKKRTFAQHVRGASVN